MKINFLSKPYLPVLEQKKYTLKYSVRSTIMPHYIYDAGTYNVYSFLYGKKKVQVNLRLYRQQTKKIMGVSLPNKIAISNPAVLLVKKDYDKATKTLCQEP